MRKQLKLMLDKTMYRVLKAKSRQSGYLSIQELIRAVLREKFGKSDMERLGERLGERIERKIKKIV